MAYNKLDLQSGDILDKDVFDHIDSSLFYLYSLIDFLQEKIKNIESTIGTISEISFIDCGNGDVVTTASIIDNGDGNVVLMNASFVDNNGNIIIL